ncbi:hypothetical protein EC968_003268 [Mortierella alpina]|nr:hypothetical protein EC968_003268 [Mortierella alpina]
MARTSSRIAAVRGLAPLPQNPSPSKTRATSRAVTRSRRAASPTGQQGTVTSRSASSRRAPPVAAPASGPVPKRRRPTRAEKGKGRAVTPIEETLDAYEEALAHIPDVEWSSPDEPYLQPKNAAPFLQFLPLADANCDFKLRREWQREAKRLRGSSDVCLNVYVYLRETTRDRSVAASVLDSNLGRPQPGGTTTPFRRATQGRIIESRARIRREIDEGHMERLGPMRSSHLAVHYARQGMPREGRRLEIPRTNTFNQMEHLDRQADELRDRDAATAAVRQAEFWTVEMKMGPNVFKVEVKVEDMRQMLGLPDMDLNGLRNFREEELNNPQEDINDDEHEDDYLFHHRRAR